MSLILSISFTTIEHCRYSWCLRNLTSILLLQRQVLEKSHTTSCTQRHEICIFSCILEKAMKKDCPFITFNIALLILFLLRFLDFLSHYHLLHLLCFFPTVLLSLTFFQYLMQITNSPGPREQYPLQKNKHSASYSQKILLLYFLFFSFINPSLNFPLCFFLTTIALDSFPAVQLKSLSLFQSSLYKKKICYHYLGI